MPEGRLSFGFMATPGGDATALRLEISHLGDTPRTPDAVCLLAPGNNMTSSRTIEEAARAFGTLLSVALQHWPNKVFVVDFPIRHVHATLEYQLLLKQEYHRVAAKMGVRYFSTNDVFQPSKRHLWCQDLVHLSDDKGMPLLADFIWNTSYSILHIPVNPVPLGVHPTLKRCFHKNKKHGTSSQPQCVAPSQRSATSYQPFPAVKMKYVDHDQWTHLLPTVPDVRMQVRDRRHCIRQHAAKGLFVDIQQRILSGGTMERIFDTYVLCYPSGYRQNAKPVHDPAPKSVAEKKSLHIKKLSGAGSRRRPLVVVDRVREVVEQEDVRDKVVRRRKMGNIHTSVTQTEQKQELPTERVLKQELASQLVQKQKFGTYEGSVVGQGEGGHMPSEVGKGLQDTQHINGVYSWVMVSNFCVPFQLTFECPNKFSIAELCDDNTLPVTSKPNGLKSLPSKTSNTLYNKGGIPSVHDTSRGDSDHNKTVCLQTVAHADIENKQKEINSRPAAVLAIKKAKNHIRGGVGGGNSIFETAISIAEQHGIQLRSGNPNKANGNCLYESIIDNINARQCFAEHLPERPEHYRKVWNTVGEQKIKASPYYPSIYTEQQWREAWQTLQTTNQYDLDYFGDVSLVVLILLRKISLFSTHLGKQQLLNLIVQYM
ncbi:uncharacterized protein LOC118229836 [Anguilla anguilla]|uniref:uncharacterized protein LOC118229836 n=1 Tax=Anguilla anguilla TaxID=7936 RepID=UPI0015B0E259|nr:uncharacterized protein LOC118229836 [Anguilla anguilla]